MSHVWYGASEIAWELVLIWIAIVIAVLAIRYFLVYGEYRVRGGP